jgi:hypothetical protein
VQNFFQSDKDWLEEWRPTGLEGEWNDSGVLIYGQATQKKEV